MKVSKNFKLRFEGFLLDLFDMLSFLVFVGGILLFIRFFIANPYTVVGKSMYPNFDEKDLIIVDKISPRFGQWHRGDIMVFVPPGKDIPYIKRIIGLPGEVVKIKDGKVEICKTGGICEVLQEDYIPDNLDTVARCGLTEFEVTDDGFFVMGDNRGHSTDSMCCFGFGCYEGANYLVPYNHIIGKVYMRIFPKFDFY